MMDATEDVALRNILLDAAAEEFAAELSDLTPVVTSLGFQRKMKAMLANPQRWAKRYGRPLWKRYLQTAAAVLLVCTMSLGTLMAVSPTARAAVLRWATEWYETHIVYRYAGEASSDELPQYHIGTPLGSYIELTRIVTPNLISVTYQNDDGTVLFFTYIYMADGTAWGFVTDDMDVTAIAIDNNEGYLFIAQNAEDTNAITWVDAELNIQFTIDGFATASELQMMAESIEIIYD
ncbi:DUF4367 domain-containing protein [Bengtsoniella intestinalis]|uniref:DUF4367 domain-containing protein n=1 Tax=Bengtsoniella intestinalis TaxID=3073143 RepID=UPI00391EFCB4